jgi:hypothetical protein
MRQWTGNGIKSRRFRNGWRPIVLALFVSRKRPISSRKARDHGSAFAKPMTARTRRRATISGPRLWIQQHCGAVPPNPYRQRLNGNRTAGIAAMLLNYRCLRTRSIEQVCAVNRLMHCGRSGNTEPCYDNSDRSNGTHSIWIMSLSK